MIFVFGVFCVLERPIFREQKKVVLVVFFTIQGRVVLRVIFFYFFLFPYMWFLLQRQEMKVMEDEDGSHVG